MPPTEREGAPDSDDPSYPLLPVEQQFPDAHYFNPLRLYRASMTYLWWVAMMLSGRASDCGTFASHLSYYRREHARDKHGAGYHDSWWFVLSAHLAQRIAASGGSTIITRIRSPHQREGRIVSDDTP